MDFIPWSPTSLPANTLDYILEGITTDIREYQWAWLTHHQCSVILSPRYLNIYHRNIFIYQHDILIGGDSVESVKRIQNEIIKLLEANKCLLGV